MFNFLKDKIKDVGKSLKGATKKEISEEDLDKLFDNLEVTLLQSDVAYELIEEIKKGLKEELVGKEIKKVSAKEQILEEIKEVLTEDLKEGSLEEIIERKEKKEGPVVILFIGVNGSGKTTSLAKLSKFLQDRENSVVFAASDTFRAAAIEQLEEHAEKLDVKVIKHQHGADAAAVAFDAVKYAKNYEKDYVLIDSAGRQHSDVNLMEELKKIKEVSEPDFTIFVGDSLTGSDAIEQARKFEEEVGYDYSVLSKADVDEKGGAILSVSYVSGKPILFLGVGQEYEDMEEFDKEKIINVIFNEGE